MLISRSSWRILLLLLLVASLIGSTLSGRRRNREGGSRRRQQQQQQQEEQQQQQQQQAEEEQVEGQVAQVPPETALPAMNVSSLTAFLDPASQDSQSGTCTVSDLDLSPLSVTFITCYPHYLPVNTHTHAHAHACIHTLTGRYSLTYIYTQVLQQEVLVPLGPTLT